MAQVSCEVTEPKQTRPTEGILFVNVELSPMAAPHFEAGRWGLIYYYHFESEYSKRCYICGYMDERAETIMNVFLRRSDLYFHCQRHNGEVQ